jgi:hypothetical protein
MHCANSLCAMSAHCHCPAAAPVDLSPGLRTSVYPAEWASSWIQEPSISNAYHLKYSYSFILTASVAVHIYANNLEVGQPLELRLGSPFTSSHDENQYAFLQLTPVPQAGQNLTLQVTSNTTDFTRLHANSTGWRASMSPPGGKPDVDLGFMQDASATGLLHEWTLSFPGDNLTLVSCAFFQLYRLLSKQALHLLLTHVQGAAPVSPCVPTTARSRADSSCFVLCMICICRQVPIALKCSHRLWTRQSTSHQVCYWWMCKQRMLQQHYPPTVWCLPYLLWWDRFLQSTCC